MRKLAAITAFGILTSASCERAASPTPVDDLATARARWSATGSTDYAVESRIRCFCPPHLAVWTRLSVRADRVEATEPLEQLPPAVGPSPLGWQTVPQLFDAIARWSRDGAITGVDVRYDQTLGYPERIAVTCRSTVTDCGGTYELRNLTR